MKISLISYMTHPLSFDRQNVHKAAKLFIVIALLLFCFLITLKGQIEASITSLKKPIRFAKISSQLKRN